MSDCNCAIKNQISKEKKDIKDVKDNKKENNDKKENKDKYITNLNKLNKIISKYDLYTTIENFSDIDIKDNIYDMEYNYSYLSTLMYGPGLRIISVVQQTTTGQIIIDPETFTFDIYLGNLKINSNEFEYKKYIIYGFKANKEFLFKNTMLNIMNKPLPTNN
jgi:hypothetical protein